MEAILSLDVTYCGDCPCCRTEETFWGDIGEARCQVNDKDVLVYLDGVSGFPSFCQLKIPKRRNDYHGLDHYSAGWNDCLDEIRRGKDGD